MLNSDVPEPQSRYFPVHTIPVVPVQQPLSPQEVERMCKAFIRLITTQEIPKENNQNPKKP